MKRRLFLLGMLAIVAAFGLVVVGCGDSNNNNNNNNGGGKTESEAVGDVSNATTAAEMKTALEEGASALGIDLTGYNTLTDAQKTAVAEAVLTGKPYENAAAIKAAFDAAVTAQGGEGNGTSWQVVADSPFGTAAIQAIAFGNGKFVATGSKDNLAWSSDGITWTMISASGVFASGSYYIFDVAYGNDRFVAVEEGMAGSDVDFAGYATDPSRTLTSVGATPMFGQLNAVTFGNNKFVIGARFGNLYYSSDATAATWAEVSSSNNPFRSDNRAVRAITYGGAAGNEVFLAVGDAGKIAKSTDGISWTSVTSPFTSSQDIQAVAYGNGTYVVGLLNGTMVYSTDLSTWTPIPAADTALNGGNLLNIAYVNNTFMAVGYKPVSILGGEPRISKSTDGITWTAEDLSGLSGVEKIYDIAYGSGKYVAFGNNKIIYK
jgi:hypothetical protein